MEELTMERSPVAPQISHMLSSVERQCSFKVDDAIIAGAIVENGVAVCGGLKENNVSTLPDFVVIRGNKALEYAWWCAENKVNYLLCVI